MSDYKVAHGNTFFIQLGKWGRDLTPDEAIQVGILKKEQEVSTSSLPAPKKATRVARNKKTISQ